MLAFDTETTGLLKPSPTEINLQPYIIEIYMAKFDEQFNITDEFESLIKPPIPISEEITGITGITNDMISNAPSFPALYDSLADFCLGETSIFAHNASFDIGMLKNELIRMDAEFKFPWPKQHFCTVELSFPIKNKRMKLSELYSFCANKTIINAHRAKNDVLPMIECIQWLWENGFIEYD